MNVLHNNAACLSLLVKGGKTMAYKKGEEREIARFLLAALLEQSMYLVGLDSEKMIEHLRTDSPITTTEIRKLVQPATLLMIRESGGKAAVTLNAMCRLFDTTDASELELATSPTNAPYDCTSQERK